MEDFKTLLSPARYIINIWIDFRELFVWIVGVLTMIILQFYKISFEPLHVIKKSRSIFAKC